MPTPFRFLILSWVLVLASIAGPLGERTVLAEANVAPIEVDLTAEPAGEEQDLSRLREALSASGRFALQQGLSPLIVDNRLTQVDTDAVRKLTGPALAHAVGIRLNAYDDSVDPAKALEQAVTILDAVAASHLSRMPAGSPAWGRDWQSPIGIAQGGLAAWLLWDKLSPATQESLEVILADEADYLATQPIFYYRDPEGNVIRPGNTGSEEESWRARGLSLAVAMLTDHPNVGIWKRQLIARQVAAFATPSDLHSNATLHGRPLGDWLAGSNVNEDGTLVNHHLIHPTYMRTPHATMSVVHQTMAGQKVSPSAIHGVDRLYAALRGLYEQDGSVRYPEGNDWGNSQLPVFYVQDLQMRVLGIAPDEARQWERLHGRLTLEKIRALGDGRAYAPGDFGKNHDAEFDIAAKFAEAWLALVVVPQRLGTDESPVDPPEQVKPPTTAPSLP